MRTHFSKVRAHLAIDESAYPIRTGQLNSFPLFLSALHAYDAGSLHFTGFHTPSHPRIYQPKSQQSHLKQKVVRGGQKGDGSGGLHASQDRAPHPVDPGVWIAYQVCGIGIR